MALSCLCLLFFFFFFHDTATTEIYTLSLHDALPIFMPASFPYILKKFCRVTVARVCVSSLILTPSRECLASTAWCSPSDRKSTRLNSSHEWISYAVFCLKKKKKRKLITEITQS